MVAPSLALLLISCGEGQSEDNATDSQDANLETVINQPVPVESEASQIDLSPIVAIGGVRTIEIDNVVFTSLPDASVDTT